MSLIAAPKLDLQKSLISPSTPKDWEKKWKERNNYLTELLSERALLPLIDAYCYAQIPTLQFVTQIHEQISLELVQHLSKKEIYQLEGDFIEVMLNLPRLELSFIEKEYDSGHSEVEGLPDLGLSKIKNIMMLNIGNVELGIVARLGEFNLEGSIPILMQGAYHKTVLQPEGAEKKPRQFKVLQWFATPWDFGTADCGLASSPKEESSMLLFWKKREAEAAKKIYDVEIPESVD